MKDVFVELETVSYLAQLVASLLNYMKSVGLKSYSTVFQFQ
jgi:hypothetical protein